MLQCQQLPVHEHDVPNGGFPPGHEVLPLQRNLTRPLNHMSSAVSHILCKQVPCSQAMPDKAGCGAEGRMACDRSTSRTRDVCKHASASVPKGEVGCMHSTTSRSSSRSNRCHVPRLAEGWEMEARHLLRMWARLFCETLQRRTTAKGLNQ